jgi:hypothetical protein
MIESIYLNTRERYQVKYIVRHTSLRGERQRCPTPTPPPSSTDCFTTAMSSPSGQTATD